VRILLATRNDAKLAELRRLVDGRGFEVVGLDDVPDFPEAPETGATFEENALAKARDAAAATGLVAVADDSGLAVDALNGMPGVLSARWSGRCAAGAVMRVFMFPPTVESRGPWRRSPILTDRMFRARGMLSRPHTEMELHLSCGTRCAGCLSQRCAFTGTTSLPMARIGPVSPASRAPA